MLIVVFTQGIGLAASALGLTLPAFQAGPPIAAFAECPNLPLAASATGSQSR